MGFFKDLSMLLKPEVAAFKGRFGPSPNQPGKYFKEQPEEATQPIRGTNDFGSAEFRKNEAIQEFDIGGEHWFSTNDVSEESAAILDEKLKARRIDEASLIWWPRR